MRAYPIALYASVSNCVICERIQLRYMRAYPITLIICNVANTQRPITAVELLTSRAAIYIYARVIGSCFIYNILNEVVAEHGPMRGYVSV
jgi:hypothetical protein